MRRLPYGPVVPQVHQLRLRCCAGVCPINGATAPFGSSSNAHRGPFRQERRVGDVRARDQQLQPLGAVGNQGSGLRGIDTTKQHNTEVALASVTGSVNPLGTLI
jgi:hypothetical protein